MGVGAGVLTALRHKGAKEAQSLAETLRLSVFAVNMPKPTLTHCDCPINDNE
jgi:hypothetical protein